jgi:SPX domain protein involved in polyphosphate accumulation
MYKLRAIELGLLAKDSKDWLRLTEEGRNWLKERTEDALKKYKLDFSVITVLMGYINDVSILPSYLTSIDEDVRNAAKKRYDELKGDNK